MLLILGKYCAIDVLKLRYHLAGAVFTFGKSKFAENAPSKFWIKKDEVKDTYTVFNNKKCVITLNEIVVKMIIVTRRFKLSLAGTNTPLLSQRGQTCTLELSNLISNYHGNFILPGLN